jgi:hypothetical protein
MDFDLFIELGSEGAAKQVARQTAEVSTVESQPTQKQLRKRASDENRRDAEDYVAWAYREGCLKKEEFDERMHGVWETVWVDELSQFTADLPGMPEVLEAGECDCDAVDIVASRARRRDRDIISSVLLILSIVLVLGSQGTPVFASQVMGTVALVMVASATAIALRNMFSE